MLLIPAIDIKDGHCVRLRQGDLTSNITVFNTDPVAQARHWVELGAERLHLVDLDAARSGKPVNLSVIRKICSEFAEDVEIEVGGGMRTLERVGEVLDLGVDYVVIGTAAVEQSWQSGDWSAVSGRILGLVALLAVFYVLSLAAGVVYTQLMAVITQGSLEKMREKMFNGMQDLPIRYFDTHNHGDIMSYYTNDIDTLRQMISQSIPQALDRKSVV